MIKAFWIFVVGSIGVFIGMAALYLAMKALVLVLSRFSGEENKNGA
jgi:hypothetical protein